MELVRALREEFDDDNAVSSAARKLLHSRELVRSAKIKSLEGAEDRLTQLGTVNLRVLPADEHKRLCEYLWDQGFFNGTWELKKLMSMVKHPFFHVLSDFLDVRDGTVDNLRQRAEGTYRLWRPSSHLPGHYVRGRIDIQADEDDAAVIRSLEVQIYQGEDGKTDGNVAARALKEVNYGYVTRKDNIIYILSRDNTWRSLHTMYLHGARMEKTTDERIRYVTMKGVVMTLAENFILAAPVYLERVEPGELQDGKTHEAAPGAGPSGEPLCLIPEDRVPAVVRAKLQHTAKGGVILF